MATQNPSAGSGTSSMADPYSTGSAGATGDVGSMANRMGKAAGSKLDEGRTAAAEGLDSAASTLHQNADSLPGGQSVKRVAHKAADALTSTADYLRQNDMKNMVTDVRTVVKNNPGPALLIAAALGFLVARSLSRD